MLYGSVREKHAGKDAVQCKDGCSAVQGRMQCTAGAVAVHCGSGCSALPLRWAKTGTEIVSPFSGYLHRNNAGLARVHYIYVQLSEESSPKKDVFALPQYLILKKCEEEREKPQTWGESVKGGLLPPVRREKATAVRPIAYS